jgi:hypothetical protein
METTLIPRSVFALEEHEFELFYLAKEFLEKEITMGNEARKR